MEGVNKRDKMAIPIYHHIFLQERGGCAPILTTWSAIVFFSYVNLSGIFALGIHFAQMLSESFGKNLQQK